jgi:hypothetical protein
MAQSLEAQHPDCTQVVWKWGRWQHSVDYSRFRMNRLIRKPGIPKIPKGTNNYNLVLRPYINC